LEVLGASCKGILDLRPEHTSGNKTIINERYYFSAGEGRK
jgi:hypothetical protein